MRYRNFGGGSQKLPARLHSSLIPELSGNQRSPVAHRELVHVEFAGREVKLPGVLHSFLTAADRPAVQILQIQEVVTCLHSIAQFSHHLHPASFPRYILAATRPGDLSKY